ncbi:MAG: V-type ATP synthase subunit F [Promethearchaeota archaeon]
MPEQKIHILGNEQIVLMLGLLGIEGTILQNSEKFLKEFNDLINQPSIGIIIVALDLSDEIVDFLIDFKLNNKTPFVYYLPDIFQPNIEYEDIFLNKIFESIGKIIS